MRVAALDLGTNTFILLVADVENDRIERVIHDEVQIVRLGQGVHENRRFHPEALRRAEECLASFSATIRRLGAELVSACATSAARDVKNGSDLVDIGIRHSIPIRIISGEREAEFTFSGTVPEHLNEPVVIVDVGGGSTEYICGGPHGIGDRVSIDVGSVRLTEMFFSRHPVSQAEILAMTEHIRQKLEPAKTMLLNAKARSSRDPRRFIAVAGTPTTLATLDQALPFESARVHGHRLTRQSLEFWVGRLAALNVAERQALAGMEAKRADVIVAGALILLCSAVAMKTEEFEVSIRGLRYGVALALGRGEVSQ